jgi:phosphoserine aminotransferase
MDWDKIDILYSHGQKNVGIAGSSITIIRDTLLRNEYKFDFIISKMKITPYMCDFEELDKS